MSIPHIYIEACPLIDMAEHRAAHGSEVTANVWSCRQALRAARDGKVRVFTSNLSVAECTTICNDLPRPPDDVKRFFDSLLMSGRSGLTLVAMTQQIAVRARDLRWNFGVNLRGADCIHVATAMAQGCTELWTRDGRIHKKREPLKDLGISATFPNLTNLLPKEYLQDDLALPTS